MAGQVQGELFPDNLFGFLLWGLFASQQPLDAEDELARAERLGHIVVRAQFQAQDAINLTGFRRQDDDGDGRGRRVAAQNFADFQPGPSFPA